MARYTLVYGVRLVKEGSVTAVDDARLSLKDGTTAGLTLHTIDGTIPQLRRALDRSLDAFFDLLPGAEDEDRDGD
jgi:hypothetical protein